MLAGALRKLRRRERGLIALFITLVFGTLCYQFMISPQLLLLKALRKEQSALATLLEEHKTLPKYLSARQERLAALKDRASALQKSFCKREQAEELFASLNGIARSSGVELISISPAEEREVSAIKGEAPAGIRFSEVETEVVAKGTFRGLINFLESLESGPPPIRLSNMRITAGEEPADRRVEFALSCLILEKEE